MKAFLELDRGIRGKNWGGGKERKILLLGERRARTKSIFREEGQGAKKENRKCTMDIRFRSWKLQQGRALMIPRGGSGAPELTWNRENRVKSESGV